MIAIQSHWEAFTALTTLNIQIAVHKIRPLSFRDKREAVILYRRIAEYKKNPTPPNIIEHKKGNV